MEIELSASMMCARYGNLAEEVRQLDEGGIDIFHIDIMDGRFVDNFGMGYQDMEFIRSATKKRMEAHLMVKNPWNYLDVLHKLGMDIVYIHPEADPDPATTLEKIKGMGMTPGIALNPGTAIPYVEELFHWTDRVLALCVNPGHAGRQFVPYMGQKIERLINLSREYSFTLEWDGACTMEKMREYAPKGVASFVLGTATLFGKARAYGEIIKEIRGEVEAIL